MLPPFFTITSSTATTHRSTSFHFVAVSYYELRCKHTVWRGGEGTQWWRMRRRQGALSAHCRSLSSAPALSLLRQQVMAHRPLRRFFRFLVSVSCLCGSFARLPRDMQMLHDPRERGREGRRRPPSSCIPLSTANDNSIPHVNAPSRPHPSLVAATARALTASPATPTPSCLHPVRQETGRAADCALSSVHRHGPMRACMLVYGARTLLLPLWASVQAE